ncbi:MAG: cytochrome c oxidase subunit 3 [Bacteroidetes bacterium]|nr:cytochrome c oxidase subunit 3 [Bacteroidota bacterium]
MNLSLPVTFPVQDTAAKESPSATAKPLLWLGIASVIMLFAGLTSAYIVRHSDPRNWLVFEVPLIFWFSTAAILASSITMHLSVFMTKKDKLLQNRSFLFLTLSLGTLFVVLQITGWKTLLDEGIGLQGHVSGAYLYILSGTHFAHIISGLIALTVVFIKSLYGKYHSGNTLGIRLCATWWHFLTGLWIYLFVFLLIFR